MRLALRAGISTGVRTHSGSASSVLIHRGETDALVVSTQDLLPNQVPQERIDRSSAHVLHKKTRGLRTFRQYTTPRFSKTRTTESKKITHPQRQIQLGEVAGTDALVGAPLALRHVLRASLELQSKSSMSSGEDTDARGREGGKADLLFDDLSVGAVRVILDGLTDELQKKFREPASKKWLFE